MKKERSLKTLPLDGGTLPFDFINTVYAWKGENLHEYLDSYEEVIKWCKKVKLLPADVLIQMAEFSHMHPKKKQEALVQLKYARRILYRFFSGVAGTGIASSVLKEYNLLLEQGISHFEWQAGKKGLQFVLKENASDLLLPLWVIMKTSHQLLLEKDAERIKECSRCGWIFLDDTKNGSRRWCNPATCGSIDKMSRYYQKIKKKNSSANPTS